MCFSLTGYSQRPMQGISSKYVAKVHNEFVSKGLQWPPKNVYIRAFKYDKELEIWVNYSDTSDFMLFKTYKICMLSGDIGPKRQEGDYQVPEGFYYINDYNIHSQYHMSLKIDYPNLSDKILSPYKHLGGLIYVHGNCVSVGCIAIGNTNIEEVFTLCTIAHGNGQDTIPIHIFPVDFRKPESAAYFDREMRLRHHLIEFEENIKEGFYRFDTSKRLSIINIGDNGKYIFDPTKY